SALSWKRLGCDAAALAHCEDSLIHVARATITSIRRSLAGLAPGCRSARHARTRLQRAVDRFHRTCSEWPRSGKTSKCVLEPHCELPRVAVVTLHGERKVDPQFFGLDRIARAAADPG